jgi:hypothetical protein
MQRRLAERLRRSIVLLADGSLGGWHEAHLLVAGDARPVLRLARIFRQRGVVCVRRGGVAYLNARHMGVGAHGLMAPLASPDANDARKAHW